MKNRKICLLALLLAFCLLLGACSFGEYEGITRPSGNVTIPPVTNSQGQVDDDPFTVTLKYEDKILIPENPIQVQWNDGYSLYSAPIDADGYARYGFLDGDYKVTLSDVPAGYTYDPNKYIASNANRNIEIELHKLVEGTGKGTDVYSPITTRNTGLYCVEITSPEQEVFFRFSPSGAGVYSIESWVDTTADVINPYANYYGANAFAAYLQFTQDDGGKEGTYTKNFKLDVQIAEESISSSGGGAAAFTFGIKASHKDGKYPVNVYISITYNGGYSIPHEDATIIVPGETLVKQPDIDKSIYEFVGAETPLTQGGGTTMVFDADNYKYWDVKNGGDGFYHVYDPAAYPETGGYGPILYAKIASPIDFLNDMPLSQIEYAGNKALTIGTTNYKMFIEGWEYLNFTNMVIPGIGVSPYFCVLGCPCRLSHTCTSDTLGLETGTCDLDCPNCDPGCRNLAKEYIGTIGYADVVNSDGCYPVTMELKEFLQKYSINQLLFMDGEGVAETLPTRPVFATEDDQWLFACGYYKERT